MFLVIVIESVMNDIVRIFFPIDHDVCIQLSTVRRNAFNHANPPAVRPQRTVIDKLLLCRIKHNRELASSTP